MTDMTEEIRDAARETTDAAEPVAPEMAATEPTAEATPEPVVAPEPDYKDKWLRAEAEIQNVRRRATRDREESVRAAEDRMLLDVIEVLDDLERALAALTAEQAAESWSQGVTLTAQRMREVLSRRGVSVVPSVGQPFDPSVHEALLEVPAPEGVKPGHVVQEVQRGYARGDRALRAARVVVARADG
jgi:molecular chaperone GrpE